MRVLLISGNREDVDIRVAALGLACIAAACEKTGHKVCFALQVNKHMIIW